MKLTKVQIKMFKRLIDAGEECADRLECVANCGDEDDAGHQAAQNRMYRAIKAAEKLLKNNEEKINAN